MEVDWAVRKLKVRSVQHLITWPGPSQFITFGMTEVLVSVIVG